MVAQIVGLLTRPSLIPANNNGVQNPINVAAAKGAPPSSAHQHVVMKAHTTPEHANHGTFDRAASPSQYRCRTRLSSFSPARNHYGSIFSSLGSIFLLTLKAIESIIRQSRFIDCLSGEARGRAVRLETLRLKGVM